MRIFVTGAGKNGFLGKNVKKVFSKKLKDHDIGYIGSEYDLTWEEDVDLLFEHIKPDIIVHMAAKCGGILANKNSPGTFVRDNVKMNLNIIDGCKNYNVKYLITLGTICMYPKYCPTPFKERDIFNGKSEETNHSYGESKKLMLTMQNAYREQYGLKSCMLMPANLMGPYDHFDLTNSHVIPALINKFINAVDNNVDTVECWGTGSATREFLFAEDLAEAIVKTIEVQPNIESPINVGTGQEISIYDLAYLIAELTEFKGNIKFTGEVSDGQPRRCLDVSKAKQYLNFTAKTSLRDGLIKTIKWYKQTI